MKHVGYLLAGALIAAATAAAKEIPPGGLHVCGAEHCRAVKDPAQARAFSELLWGHGRIARAPTPRVGSPVFQLRYRTGPVGAIITATSIRVAGLNCGRFQRGKWYRLPAKLRGLTRGLEPRRLSAYVPRSC
jgi:hypothetical protein